MSIARKMQMAAAGAAAVEGWDLANAAYNGSPVNWFYVGAQETSPSGVFFKLPLDHVRNLLAHRTHQGNDQLAARPIS